MPATSLSNVLLPEPLRPTKATDSPARIVSDTLRKAQRSSSYSRRDGCVTARNRSLIERASFRRSANRFETWSIWMTTGDCSSDTFRKPIFKPGEYREAKGERGGRVERGQQPDMGCGHAARIRDGTGRRNERRERTQTDERGDVW